MRRFVVEVTAFLALTIAIPLAAELALRLLDVRTDTPVFEPALGADGTHVLRLSWNPQFRSVQPPQPQREFQADKQAGTFRIFVIGESPAAGNPYGTALSFSAWLARRLAAQAPDVRWEVVNAALAGLQSWSALAIAHDIARYDPDLLVVYLGHNEIGTRFSPNERRWLDPRGFGWRTWIVDSRLYQALSRVLPARVASRLIDPRSVAARPGNVNASETGRPLHATPADRALSAAIYRARLVEMVRSMRDAGAHTILLTLSQNFSEWAPALSSHRSGLRPEEKAAWRAAVRAGDALAPQDCAGALAAWSRALALDDTFADLQFKVASCERTLGSLEAATAHFRLASDLDQRSQGAPTSFNDIVRDVARQEGAIVVDVDLEFTRASGARLVGYDLFVDSLHINLRGHQLIAEVLANAIRESGVAGRQVRWNPDAYVDPDPDALLDASPELRFRESITRAFSCQAAGRPGCAR
jgi:lysophospholipase L1-like esterase